MNSKNVLQKIEVILAVIIIILIVAIVVVFILTITKKQEVVVEDEQKVEYVAQLENMIEKEKEEILKVKIEREIPTPTPEPEEQLIPLDTMYNGFAVAGKITIPKTGVDTLFLDSVSVPGMTQAPCLLYKTGDINISGNTFIVGHNYRNGTLFSDNKNLEINDKIIITVMDGSSREYTIYDKFITTPEDTTYLKREIGDSPEITLQCCTDDDENRIIILAK